MKNNIFKTLGLLFTLALALGSCSEENKLTTDGEGKVCLKMSISDDVTVFGRSSIDTDDLAERCTTYICNSEGLIRKYYSVSEVPSELWLVSGDYTVMAWTGDSVAASFHDKYYTAYTPFTISSSATSTVSVECKIANVVASVNMDSSVDDVLTNYTITFANAKGSLEFDSSNMDDAKGYFMMADDETDLTWSIKAEQYDGTPYEQTGTISNAASATEYALYISYNSNSEGSDNEYGGVMLDITVDQSEVDVNGSVVVTSAPKIFGVSFDLENTIYSPVGNFRDISVWVSAATSLANLEVSCDGFISAGVPVSSMDFMKMTESAKTQIAEAGISNLYDYDSEADVSTAKITFGADMLNQLPEGEHNISIKAVDDFGKSRTEVLKINISDAKVATNAIVRTDVWATKATITGNIADAEAQNFGFNYREKGAADWTSVDAATVDASSFSYIITGLVSGTTYEYAAKCDGYVDSNTQEFTTETEFIIPNAGFEYWSTVASGAVMPMASGDSFWDSGNHGTISMSKNITTSDSSVKNSGSYSAKLASQFVGIGSIGAFAAGNIFAGEFGDVIGLGAKLFFGREFNESRPTKLVGYMKYTPGTVDYDSDYISDGDSDICSIYIALSDSGSTYEVNTSTSVFFSKDSDGVFAYGELAQSTATAGDGMVRFEIPIEYTATDRIPNIIVLVASASKYGDYFSGSTSSVLWIDDLELIYE
ncbi:MAG: PCMD domain-containing protein [Bacteroidales bacterium]